MGKLVFAIPAAAVALTLFTTPVFAESGAARILRLVGPICEDFKPTLKSWASRIDGHGSYAVPVAPRSMKLSCDNPGPAVPVGQSFGFDSSFPADQAALKYCNDKKPADFKSCVIIARSLPAQ